MKLLRLFPIFIAIIMVVFSVTASSSELPRSRLLGIMPERVDGDGVVLQTIVPNSTAASIGLKVGDQITSINQQPISDFNSLLAVIRPIKSNQPITVKLKRDGKTETKSGVMQPRPYEMSEHAKVLYESVDYSGNRLRSITYKPKSLAKNEKAPALFFIQGYTCGSIDMGMMPQATTKQMMDQFAEAGYVVFRVEKPGIGDSQSDKHCSEIDFTTESIAFTQALKTLKQQSYVDPDQVYLWGHSLGVLHSAVVANNESVAGVIGFGGVLKPWYDYMLDIYQVQSVKHFGASKRRAKRNTELMQPVLDLWLNTDKSWVDIVNHKATKAALDADMIQINGEQVIDRHYSFFRDLNRYNLASYWQKLDVPLLMMHGSLDIQAIEKKWAFDLVALSSDENSKAIEIEGAEHAFMHYDSASDYSSARNSRRFNPAQPGDRFDKRIGEQTLEWLQTLKPVNSAKPQYSGVNHIKYVNDNEEKSFVGNGFLISHKNKTYAVTVKHALLEAKTKGMKSVSIEGHIRDWSIHPNQKPEQFIKLGKLLNESKQEALDMKILSKDWLIFEVEQNASNLQVLSLREQPLTPGEELTAYGCSYATKAECIQDTYIGTYIGANDTNLRLDMPNLDMSQLRGLSGSPVLDKNNKVVGIVSNVLPKTAGTGFDFAPANLSYLLTELAKISG